MRGFSGLIVLFRVVLMNTDNSRRPARKKDPESYSERFYRSFSLGKGLESARVCVEETDLQIFTTSDVLATAKELVIRYRLQLERYIQRNPTFESSLIPLESDILATPIVQEMLAAGKGAGVGPMAAVAGTISQYVGEGLLADGQREVIVENGGDVFLSKVDDCTVAIFAGESPLSYTVGIRIRVENMPCGVCTSSGTVGHSLSFGDADSVTVVAKSTALADAVATRLGNEVGSGRGGKAGVQRALDCAKNVKGIIGVVVICGAVMGAVGDVELVRL